jgi:TatD DNase family protein
VSLVDSHCHLDDSQFDGDRQQAIDRALEAGVEKMVVIGTGNGPPDLEGGIRLAEKHAPILATVGIHPEHALKATAETLQRVAELLAHPKVIAVGEIGLDYHWQPFDRSAQHAIFVEQMRIARDGRKPIVIHTRDAWEDTMILLKEHWVPAGLPCVLHCFTGGPEEARHALDLGFYLSFGGVTTYPKALAVQEAVKLVPLDRMLVETDAPYLPPVPYRGKRNEPAYVAHTVRKIAELRGEDLQLVAKATTSNFMKAFVGYTREFHELQ